MKNNPKTPKAIGFEADLIVGQPIAFFSLARKFGVKRCVVSISSPSKRPIIV